MRAAVKLLRLCKVIALLYVENLDRDARLAPLK